jgi:hypothetical protein
LFFVYLYSCIVASLCPVPLVLSHQ